MTDLDKQLAAFAGEDDEPLSTQKVVRTTKIFSQDLKRALFEDIRKQIPDFIGRFRDANGYYAAIDRIKVIPYIRNPRTGAWLTVDRIEELQTPIKKSHKKSARKNLQPIEGRSKITISMDLFNVLTSHTDFGLYEYNSDRDEWFHVPEEQRWDANGMRR